MKLSIDLATGAALPPCGGGGHGSPHWTASRLKRQRDHQSGFTLIELMVTIVVLAILLGIGIPSFQETIRQNRTTAVANDLVTALQFARSEAVRRGQAVSFCMGSDLAVCNGNLLNGWYVTTTPGNVNGAVRQWPAPRAGAEFLGGGQIDFGGLGATGANTIFRLRYTGCTGDGARRIQVAPMGRVTLEAIACVPWS